MSGVDQIQQQNDEILNQLEGRSQTADT